MRTNVNMVDLYEVLGHPPCPGQISRWEFYDDLAGDYCERGIKVECVTASVLHRLSTVSNTFALPIPLVRVRKVEHIILIIYLNFHKYQLSYRNGRFNFDFKVFKIRHLSTATHLGKFSPAS